jgi:hypothetical protein
MGILLGRDQFPRLIKMYNVRKQNRARSMALVSVQQTVIGHVESGQLLKRVTNVTKVQHGYLTDNGVHAGNGGTQRHHCK